MQLIKLTHANLKRTLYVAGNLVAGFYYSEANQCTHVVASGGAIFPALESAEEIQKLLVSIQPNHSPKEGGATHEQ